MGESEQGPLRHADLFHTGIVVDDLASAKADLGDLLGAGWHTGGADVRLITDGGARTVRTAYALSREGPHHVELCQAIEGTLWTATAPGRAHHLGYWVDDVASASAAMERFGSPRIASIAVTDDAPPLCAYHRTRSGLYVEIVGLAFKPLLFPAK
ncbi:VOC family protein [Actinomadura sp. 7K507]|uniref:VOC family protein n=1 Tax=Actinomadura sp. 7K507 TaxID=2530365 RepID=UPI0010498B19|nr:VOC family protein [Actinomadura sp. 7K507]TDC98397.1 VOC family protein [Actinomadura sp. 7K507]